VRDARQHSGWMSWPLRGAFSKPPALRVVPDCAATSIGLNLAEGAGEFSPRDKARFYRMARRSAVESAAILDIVAQRRHAPAEKLARAQQLLVAIVSMLVRLIANPAGARAR
jgi:hypothetical protein